MRFKYENTENKFDNQNLLQAERILFNNLWIKVIKGSSETDLNTKLFIIYW